MITDHGSLFTDYGYTGRRYDQESGLWYFRARYFDTVMGRFISRDPLGYIDGMGLYNGYFGQYFTLDPEGRAIWIPAIILAARAAAIAAARALARRLAAAARRRAQRALQKESGVKL